MIDGSGLASSILHACEILDTPPEAEYDDAIQVAAAVFGTSLAIFGLADGDRVWFKSKLGVPMNQIPRGETICCSVMGSPGPVVIPDILADARVRETQMLREMGMRFFCGVPVRCSGSVVGTLCTFDPNPHSPSAASVAALDALGRQVGALLDTRLANARLKESERQLATALQHAEVSNEHANLAARRFETLFSRVPVPCFTCDTELTIFEWNRSAARLWGMDAYEVVMRPMPEVLGWPEESGFIADALRRVFDGESIEGYEWPTTAPDGSVRWLSCSAFPLHSSNRGVVGAICACVDVTAIHETEQWLNDPKSALRKSKVLTSRSTLKKAS